MHRHLVWSMVVLFISLASTAAYAGPELLLSFDFDNGLVNTGSWGGEATLVDDTEGEGPIIVQGVGRGGSAGLDFTRTSAVGIGNGGGRLLYQIKPESNQLTLSFWFKITELADYSRICQLTGIDNSPPIDVHYRNGCLFVQFNYNDISIGRAVEVHADEWHFLAVAIDGEAQTRTFYLGNESDPMKEIVFWEGPFQPDDFMGERLSFGNHGEGHRPFKGYMDSIQIRQGALSEAEIEGLRQETL